MPQGAVGRAGGRVEEAARGRGVPDVHRWPCMCHHLDVLGGVGVHQAALDRHVHGSAQRRLETADEGRGHGVAAAVDSLADAGEGAVDVVRPQLRQPHPPELRLEVPVEGHAVEPDTRGAQVHPSVEPLVEEVADQESRPLDVDATVESGQRLRQGLACLAFGCEAALLDLPTSALRVPWEVMAVVPGAVLLVAVRPSTLSIDQRLRGAGAPLVRLTLHRTPCSRPRTMVTPTSGARSIVHRLSLGGARLPQGRAERCPSHPGGHRASGGTGGRTGDGRTGALDCPDGDRTPPCHREKGMTDASLMTQRPPLHVLPPLNRSAGRRPFAGSSGEGLCRRVSRMSAATVCQTDPDGQVRGSGSVGGSRACGRVPLPDDGRLQRPRTAGGPARRARVERGGGVRDDQSMVPINGRLWLASVPSGSASAASCLRGRAEPSSPKGRDHPTIGAKRLSTGASPVTSGCGMASARSAAARGLGEP